jgi:hypothetical protein
MQRLLDLNKMAIGTICKAMEVNALLKNGISMRISCRYKK